MHVEIIYKDGEYSVCWKENDKWKEEVCGNWFEVEIKINYLHSQGKI